MCLMLLQGFSPEIPCPRKISRYYRRLLQNCRNDESSRVYWKSIGGPQVIMDKKVYVPGIRQAGGNYHFFFFHATVL